MKSILIVFLIFLQASIGFAQMILIKGPQGTPTLSYSEWKTNKINFAKEQINDTKNKIQLIQARSSGPKDPQLLAVNQILNQHEFNLEVAQDLAIIDYVVLYLSAHHHNPKVIKDAASKLSPVETEQLLEAYVKSVKANQVDLNSLKLPRHSIDRN